MTRKLDDETLMAYADGALGPEEAAAVVEEARRAGRSAVRLLVQLGTAQPRYVGVELLPR